MAILVDAGTRVLVQGITGNEGSRAALEMVRYGTPVLAGVTPGKGGKKIEGVPVYNTVSEAMRRHPNINASLVAVPAPHVRDAVLEALEAAIKLVVILTEHVPVQDSVLLIAWARRFDARIIGPSSVGIISPGKGKIGSIAFGGINAAFSPGPVGIISKSGGMTTEIAAALTRAGIGQSTAVGIGGDRIIGADFLDLLQLFERDRATKAVVLFGEIGGSYEEKVAEALRNRVITKPLAAIIAGRFTQQLPQESILGHAGAIVEKGRGSYASKRRALKAAGVLLADTIETVPLLMKKILRARIRR